MKPIEKNIDELIKQILKIPGDKILFLMSVNSVQQTMTIDVNENGEFGHGIGHKELFIAKLANAMAKANINIVDVNQKIMENYFVMTMAVDIARAKISIPQIHRHLDKIADQMKLKVTFQDETIFKMMHRV